MEELLHSEQQEPVDAELLHRFMPGYEGALDLP